MSTTSMTAPATSPSRLESMRAASSTTSSKPAPTGPSKKSDAPAKTKRQDKPNVNSANDSNAADTGTAAAATRPDHGRRSRRTEDANWLNAEKPGNAYRPADKELSQNVKVVQDDILNREQAQREQAERAQRQKEKLEQHISESPAGFQAALPRLNELDVANSWDKLLRMMRSEYDMSCLTSCLARELDEDVAWNPEMLLVQLTSDMLDAAELQKDSGEAYVPVDASDIGQMTGGEVARKRKAKRTKAAGGAEGEPEKDTEMPATASPPPTSQAATSKTPRKKATTDPAAAEPKKTQTGKAQNAGPTSAGNSSLPQKGSAAGSTSGAAGGGGGSKTSAAPSTAKRDASKDANATKSSSSKKKTSKQVSK
ncbi:hypothetical protein, conserved [Leishmania tarentolae]|uniref:Uncharacterized protein n=1 Tax=Leishmania tarentolae TaxID=5689 RepID=A0A640KKJ7_LEITA|nr:Chain A, NET domain-containing protein [Leishmania tarentolae]8F5P_A Chain A, NET domain-containing protein [Leishmania tarentolae]GET89848.1 hypothetical protein, conserved [Leishmania tarentolae]